jgi:hypothetical protein
MRYLTVRKFASESGYTEAAVRSKIADGTWVEDQVWRHAPDGRVLIDVIGYEAWVEMGKPSTTNQANRLRSRPSRKPLLSKGQQLSPKPLV